MPMYETGVRALGYGRVKRRRKCGPCARGNQRDGGKDLIVAHHADIGNFIYYVECKKYAPTNPVGVKLVRELAGTISGHRVTAGIMVTSSYFPPDAVIFSEKLKHQISLIDFLRLKKWIGSST